MKIELPSDLSAPPPNLDANLPGSPERCARLRSLGSVTGSRSSRAATQPKPNPSQEQLDIFVARRHDGEVLIDYIAEQQAIRASHWA